VQNGFNLGATVYFRYLGIRMVTNSTDIQYRATKKVAFHARYAYSDRVIKTIEGFSIPQFANSAENDAYRVSNHLNSVTAGVRLRPWKPFSVTLDAELGRANNPLTPVSDRNYHGINGRIEYRVKKLQLSTACREAYNLNAPTVFYVFDSHSRQYSANASWAPRDWFSLDASYVKLHLDTRDSLLFFATTTGRPQLQSGYPSYYFSNVHDGNLAVRFGIGRRADLYLGYAIVKDTGDGRATQVPPGTTNPISQLLDSVQTFPLTYQTPLARLSVKITPKVRWNAGWQMYNYGEMFRMFGADQNFHAQTGYSSVLWSF
jgi:hypothetical protein